MRDHFVTIVAIAGVAAGVLLVGTDARAGGAPPPPSNGPVPHASGCSGPDPTGKDDLSGLTLEWTGDDSGVGPAAGATVLFEFCKGTVDVTGYKLPDGVQTWSGTYDVHDGLLEMNVDGLASADVPAPGQAYRGDSDTIELPFALVKAKQGKGTSKYKKTKRAVETKVVKAKCEPIQGRLPECLPPGGLGSTAFGDQCLYQDTTIDGAQVSHAIACVATCTGNAQVPAPWACDPCLATFAGKTMFRSVGAMSPAPRKQLIAAYAALTKRATEDAALAVAADAAVTAAQANLAAIEQKAGHSVADVSAAQDALGAAKQTAATVTQNDNAGANDPANQRRAERRRLEQQIVDLTFAEMLPYNKACYYDPGPVEFTYEGVYSAAVNGDECTADLESLSVPMQIVPHAHVPSGKIKQEVYDSAFYEWRRSTGAVTMSAPEEVGAAIVHEGYHWRQVGCGAPENSSPAVTGALYRLHEIQAYNQSTQTAYYKFVLSPPQQRAWVNDGVAVQVAELDRLIDGKGMCRKTKQIVAAPVKLTDAEIDYVAHWIRTIDDWFTDRLFFGHYGPEGPAIWQRLCGGKGTGEFSCVRVDRDKSTIEKPTQRCPSP